MLSTTQLKINPIEQLNPDSLKKPWVIIGAGPVGSMMAAMLTTLFPEQEIHVFDKYYMNVRGHGLDIHAATIHEMKHILNEAKNRTDNILQEKKLTKTQEKYYQNIVKRIQRLIDHLDKEISGQFIRTFKISEMMQKYCKKVGKGLLHFHLKSEILTEDLNILADDSIPPINEKQAILKNAEIIFGADGSHSGVRKTIFSETSDDLRKDVLTYLLEIKLEMNEKPNRFFDKLSRSVIPTLKSGQLHIWNQSIDGTATLHVFINQKVYDQLHVKDMNGTYKGTFANPYRRLIDLPTELKDEIERIVVDIIDSNKIHASTLKITAIPMHVYKARQLIKMVGNKRVALVGDSGVGLVLARSANNGLYATSDYTASLYHEHLDKVFGQNKIPDFANYQHFWEEQHGKLDKLINDIDRKDPLNEVAAVADRQIKILDEYEKQYDYISKLDLDDNNYTKLVTTVRNNFYLFVCNLTSCGYNDGEIKNSISDIFKNLINISYLQAHPITNLHACQNRLIKRANNKIEEAKFEVKLLDTVQKVYDTSYKLSSISSYSFSDDPANYYSLEDLELHRVKVGLDKLKEVISSFNLIKNPEYESFSFVIDRMYLALERIVKTISSTSMVPYYEHQINAMIKFLASLPSIGTDASKKYLNEFPIIDNRLVTQAIEMGNYLFNQARRLQFVDNEELISLAIGRIKNYATFRKNNGLSWYEYAFGIYNADEANTYKQLLSQNIHPSAKLVLLYSLFKNPELKYLNSFVFKGILNSNTDATELDFKVLCEVLQNKIMENAGTKQIKVFDDFANQFLQISDHYHVMKVITNLTKMLAQLENIQHKVDDQSIICVAVRHLVLRDRQEYEDNDNDDVSFSSTSFSSSLFKPIQKVTPECMEILQDAQIDSTIKLSVILALLTNEENPSLQKSLSAALGNQLDHSQVAEVVEARLKNQLAPEHSEDFSSAVYKLKWAINNGSPMKKELKMLNKLFSPLPMESSFKMVKN